MARRAKNAVVLAKAETTVGTDAAPTAADAILVENPAVDPQVDVITTNEANGSLDSEGPINGGIRGRITFSVLLKGSGTAATAPNFGELLKGCGFEEVITAEAVPAVAEALEAGASQTAATLGASAAATAQAYRGMPINFTGGVEGSSFISDYSAGKVATLADDMGDVLDAGTDYQIPANVLYKPTSDRSIIKTLTLYVHLDGIRYRFVGCLGNVNLTVDAAGIGRLAFDFMGHFVDKTDVAVPSVDFGQIRPPLWRKGKMLMHRVASAVQQLTLGTNNQIVMPGDPNAEQGFGFPLLVSRGMAGSVDPLEELVATRDIMTDFKDGNRRILHARAGSVVGNRWGLTIPAAHYTGQGPADRDGLVGVNVPFAATGKDSGAFLCFF